VRTFSCLDQFLSMAFAQITFRESLRDIEACFEAHAAKAYHLGLRGNFTRSNLADANERCDWRLYCDFAQALIRIARKLYATEPLGLELDNTVYALDFTTIDLCLTLFPWAPFRSIYSVAFGGGMLVVQPGPALWTLWPVSLTTEDRVVPEIRVTAHFKIKPEKRRFLS